MGSRASRRVGCRAEASSPLLFSPITKFPSPLHATQKSPPENFDLPLPRERDILGFHHLVVPKHTKNIPTRSIDRIPRGAHAHRVVPSSSYKRRVRLPLVSGILLLLLLPKNTLRTTTVSRVRRSPACGGHVGADGQGEGVRGGQDRAHAQAGGVAGQGELQGHDPRRHHRAQPRQRHQPLLPPNPHLRHRIRTQVRRKGGGVRHDPGPGLDRGQRRDHQARGAGQGALQRPHHAHEGPGQGLGHRLRARRQAHHRPPNLRQHHHPAQDRRRVQAAHAQRLLRRRRQGRRNRRRSRRRPVVVHNDGFADAPLPDLASLLCFCLYCDGHNNNEEIAMV